MQGAQAYATPSTTPQSLAIATRVAEAGTVLLKNQAGVLPLEGPGKRIAVIGPAAGAHGAELCAQGNGSAHVALFTYQPGVIPPLHAVQARAAEAGDTVTYAEGTATQDGVAAAAGADYAVVFICDAEIEGADRPDFNADFGPCLFAVQVVESGSSGCFYAPIDQNALVSAVAAANPRTIVVLQTGDPVAMPWLDRVEGLVNNWYPARLRAARSLRSCSATSTPPGTCR
jgi:beta-glucosidase